MELNEFKLRAVEDSEIEMVLNWRNRDDIRSKMYDSRIISLEEHLQWYHKIKTENDRVCLIFEHQKKPLGVVVGNLRIKESNTWGWGCYLAETGPIPGMGLVMGILAMIHFFETIGVEVLVGEMIKTNKKSHRFNIAIGFRAVKELMVTGSEGVPIDSILLAQTKNDWIYESKKRLSSIFPGLGANSNSNSNSNFNSFSSS